MTTNKMAAREGAAEENTVNTSSCDHSVSETDRITIVSAAQRPDGTYIRLTKKIMADGIVEGYDKAKAVKTSHKKVSNINDVARVLGEIQGYQNKAVIRGLFVGKENVLPENNRRKDGTLLREGTYCRNNQNFPDTPHHWMMVDIDGYEDCSHDPVHAPEAATREFIEKVLPPSFHNVTFVWQLSSSAGTQGQERILKAHLWFWLSKPWDSTSLKIWAEALNHAKNAHHIDTSVYEPAQLHYCAAPVLDDGVENPVPERLGVWESPDGKDEVDLVLSTEMLLDSEKVRNASCQLEFKDQSTKPGHVGLFYRAFPDWNEVVFEILNGHFEEGDAEHRLTWLNSDSGSLNGVWIAGPSQHHIGASHNSWPWGANRVVTLFDCVRELIFNEDGKDDVLPDDEFERLGMEDRKDFEKPSFKEMCKWMDGHPAVQACLAQEKEEQIADKILFSIASFLERTDDLEQLAADLDFQFERINSVFDGLIWLATKSKFLLMTGHKGCVMSSVADLGIMVKEHFGRLMGDPLAVVERAAREMNQNKAWVKESKKLISQRPLKVLVEKAKAHHQVNQLEIEVDMFSEAGRVAFCDSTATLIFTHRPFPAGEFAPAIITDYKSHFPEIDDFIRLLAASRFASSRKKAHLWLKCDSDWGKSFLMAALDRLGLVVETTVSEVEKMLAGGPVGKTIDDFQRVWCLCIDEFKGVSRELKQTSEYINFAPKGLATVRAPLYMKLFMSAEAVDSLGSRDTGIEDQFANRFTYIAGRGSIENRQLFMASKARYREAVTAYIAMVLNERVAYFRSLGPQEAADAADAELLSFYGKYRIDRQFKRLSEALVDISGRFAEACAEAYIRQQRNDRLSRFQAEAAPHVFETPNQGLCLASPKTIASRWIEHAFTRAEQGKLGYKINEIVEALGKTETKSALGGDRKRGVQLGIEMPVESIEEDFQD